MDKGTHALNATSFANGGWIHMSASRSVGVGSFLHMFKELASTLVRPQKENAYFFFDKSLVFKPHFYRWMRAYFRSQSLLSVLAAWKG